MQTTSEIQHTLFSLYFSTMKKIQHKKDGMCGETCKQDFGTLIGKPIHSNVLFVPKSEKKHVRHAMLFFSLLGLPEVWYERRCLHNFVLYLYFLFRDVFRL